MIYISLRPDHPSGGEIAFLMGGGTHHPIQVTETDLSYDDRIALARPSGSQPSASAGHPSREEG